VDVEYPLPSGFTGPGGIAVTRDDSAWFTDSPDDIGRVTESGAFTEYPLQGQPSFYGGLGGPITAGPDGNLYFADSAYIGRMTPSGAITYIAGVPSPTYAYLQGIGIGPDGNVWFTVYGATSYVGYVTPGGAMSEYALPGRDQILGGITAGPGGAMWFANETADAVESITTGGILTQYVLPDGPNGAITTGPDGQLWFAAGGYIGAMTTSGVYTMYQTPSGEQDNSGSLAVDHSTSPATLVFVAYGAIGQVSTSGTMSFASTVGLRQPS
jgi:virginiamycin B lyase